MAFCSAAHRRTGEGPTSSLLLGLAGLWLGACSPAPLELESTPQPTLVTQADYRFTVLGLNPVGEGRDFNADGRPDNALPVILDSLLATVEASVLAALETSTEDPEQVWALLESLLVGSGLPVSAEAYTQATEEATRTASLCVMLQLEAADSASGLVPVTGQMQLGTLTSSGVTLDGALLGAFEGAGVPEASIHSGSAVLVPYPASWFTLTLWGSEAGFSWDSAGVHLGQLSGVVPLDALIDAYLAPIPATILVGDTVVTIPKALIAANVADELTHVTLADGSPAVDQLWMGDPAVSAAWYLEGRASKVQAE